MVLEYCHECGNKYDNDLPDCPKCGARNRGKVQGGGGEERSLFGRILIIVYICVTILALYQIISVMGDHSAAFNDISVKE